MALTIQHAGPSGKWTCLLGHDCQTVAEMQRYVATLGSSSLRVADDSTEGEFAFTPEPKPTFEMSWDEFDAEEQRLKDDIAIAAKAKDDAWDNTDLWIARVRSQDALRFKLRTLRENMGPRPSPDLEPGVLYRLIQGKHYWGQWFDLNGLRVRSTLRPTSWERDAATIEIQLYHLVPPIAVGHEINNARGWDRFWWLNEPSTEEKIRLRKWAKELTDQKK